MFSMGLTVFSGFTAIFFPLVLQPFLGSFATSLKLSIVVSNLKSNSSLSCTFTLFMER